LKSNCDTSELSNLGREIATFNERTTTEPTTLTSMTTDDHNSRLYWSSIWLVQKISWYLFILHHSSLTSNLSIGLTGLRPIQVHIAKPLVLPVPMRDESKGIIACESFLSCGCRAKHEIEGITDGIYKCGMVGLSRPLSFLIV